MKLKLLFLALCVLLLTFQIQAKAKLLKHKSKNNKQYVITKTHVHDRRCSTYHTLPQLCITMPNCGWCSARQTCVTGSSIGPKKTDSCSQTENYIFDQPTGNWDPYSYNHNVHWNPYTQRPEASGFYTSTPIDVEISLPGVKVHK